MIWTIGWPKQAYEDVLLRQISILQSKQLIYLWWNIQWIISLWECNSNTFYSPPAELGWFFCQNVTKWRGQLRTLFPRTFPLVTICKQNEVPVLCVLKCCVTSHRRTQSSATVVELLCGCSMVTVGAVVLTLSISCPTADMSTGTTV